MRSSLVAVAVPAAAALSLTVSPCAFAASPATPSSVPSSSVSSAPSTASVLVAPGTASRPVLSAAEASAFTPAAYFARSGTVAAPTADPWRPGPVAPPRRGADYVVGTASGSTTGTATAAGYPSVQAAVNAAVLAGGTTRRYIKILPGSYQGAVLIPATAPPLTLYGAGADPAAVDLNLTVTAIMSPAQYAAAVNPSGQYAPGDPGYAMYTSCAGKTTATVGGCAAVVWSQAADLQLVNLGITNTLLDAGGAGTAQAVALRTDGDRTQLERTRLISRQDTFQLNTPDATLISRVSVRDSYIEGDVDYVYGRATAVFENDEFRSVTTRRPAGNGFVFAPSTAPNWPFGFLVVRSRLTADAGYQAAPTAYLGRAWDAGAGTTGYIPGTSPNGQLVIRDSLIGPGYRTLDPWAPAATTNRPFAGDAAVGRNLDDPAFNRLWEFHNCQVAG
jgi:pectinesterase